MAVKHRFRTTVPDGPDPNAIKPSNWLDDHDVDAGTIPLAWLANISATKRVIGRNSAGAGVPEEVTASQLFDWVSATNGVLLTRTAGTWAAVANVTTDNGDLVLATNGAPVAPAAGATKIFGAPNAGRQLIGALGAVGSKSVMQPFIGQSHIAQWLPSGMGLATFTTIGMQTPQASGTATARNPTATNAFTAGRRVGLVSATSAASVAGLRTTAAFLCRVGGFHVVWRVGLSDAVVATTGRTFIGLQASSSAPTDVDPSTLVNTIGIGTDANDTVLQLYASGAAAQARVSLGANFPANTTSVDVYEVSLYCPANSNVSYQVTRVNTGDVASGTISVSANLPATSTFLTPQLWRTNGSTAAAAGIDFFSLYLDTDV